MTARARLLASLTLASVGLGCATVRTHQVREDYAQVDRQRVKRLVVVTQPLPDGRQAVGELWSLIARRYVNQKRQFIVRENAALAGPADAFNTSPHCQEELEGVLWLQPELRPRGGGMEAEVIARLFRCYDGEEVWRAEAGGSWGSEDAGLDGVRSAYVEELGPEVEAYFVPSWRLLTATLDTLPDPVLTDEDAEEKIELGE